MLNATPPELSPTLPCHQCGYDLRAQPAEGVCPECGASVEEARQQAKVPIRPAWRNSDPRWRRRLIAGVWVLVLMPLVECLNSLGLSPHIPVPTPFGFQTAIRSFEDTYLSGGGILSPYPCIMLLIGMVLLFATERGRQRNRLDWTRRWGVFFCYCMLPLGASWLLSIWALVSAGIAALFMSMPPMYQPASTEFLVFISSNYLWYGPFGEEPAVAATAICSSLIMLLASVPLYRAMRSSGPRLGAIILLTPLVLAALGQIVYAGIYVRIYTFNLPGLKQAELPPFFFLDTDLLGRYADSRWQYTIFDALFSLEFLIEAIKWFMLLAIALWLTAAQGLAWRHRRDDLAA